MSRHKLIPYELKIREKGQTLEYADLLNLVQMDRYEHEYAGDLASAPETFIELFDEYAHRWQGSEPHIDSELQKTLRVSERDGEYAVDEENNIIEAIFKYGEFGQSVDAYDTEDGTTQTNQLEPSESAETPLYLLLHIPEDESREAIVVMEQSSNRGMKGRFQDALQTHLPNGIVNEMSVRKDEGVYQETRGAERIARIRVQTSESPDALGGRFEKVFSPSASTKNVQYTPSEDGSIRLDVDELENWIENNENPFRNINGDTYSEFKVTVENAGSQTTIDFLDNNLGVELSRILDSVEMEAGHPVPAYMGQEARQFVNQELLPSGSSQIPTESLLRDGSSD